MPLSSTKATGLLMLLPLYEIASIDLELPAPHVGSVAGAFKSAESPKAASVTSPSWRTFVPAALLPEPSAPEGLELGAVIVPVGMLEGTGEAVTVTV